MILKAYKKIWKKKNYSNDYLNCGDEKLIIVAFYKIMCGYCAKNYR